MAHRAEKTGVGRLTQAKMEARYAEEEAQGVPGRVITWIHAVLKDDGIKPLTQNRGWRDIQHWLRDGTVMCTLINKLLAAKGLPPVKFKQNAHTQFVALENITAFNRGAKAYGVPDPQLFDPIDLYEGLKGPFLNPMNCLNHLGQIANKNGYEPKYEVIRPLLDSEMVGMLD